MSAELSDEIMNRISVIQRLKFLLKQGEYVLTDDLKFPIPDQHKKAIRQKIRQLMQEVRDLADKALTQA